MRRFLSIWQLCLIPLVFIFLSCGMMTSINALKAPAATGPVGSHFTFRLSNEGSDGAWAADGTDYVFFGIEIYYRLFTTSQSGSIINLTTSSQLAVNSFRRMYMAGDMAPDVFDLPVLNIRDEIDPPGTYTFLDFDCYFDDVLGTLTVTYIDDNGDPILGKSFELKRAVYFPEGHPTGPENNFKGFNQFEYTDPYKDADITQELWDMINDEPPEKVYLMLYAYSYGFSLDPNHLWTLLESPLEYIGQIDVTCRAYVP